MKKIPFIFAIACAFGCVQSSLADWKNYNAASCVPFSGASGRILNSSNIYNNSSSTVLKVDCQAIKDTSSSINSAYIEVKDLSSSEDVSCTLVSHFNKIGESGIGFWSQTKKTSGINSSWTRLSFSGLSEADNGHYYISCSVPKKTSNGVSYLGTFRIDEN